MRDDVIQTTKDKAGDLIVNKSDVQSQTNNKLILLTCIRVYLQPDILYSSVL